MITDGYVLYDDDHLQIVVDCHFMIKPTTGNEYWDNRQNILELEMETGSMIPRS